MRICPIFMKIKNANEIKSSATTTTTKIIKLNKKNKDDK